MNMNWGLVIQGPVVSFGQGPNNVTSGFSAREAIEANIKSFAPYVCQIVVSTWENSGLDFRSRFSDNVVLIENRLPVQRDHDNRIKQFVSTYEGVKFLAANSNATHILKIRTDQVVDPAIIRWLNDFFMVCAKWFDREKTLQESFIVFSDMRKDNPFYLGDFIFAGTCKDLVAFCKANLGYGTRNLHPSIGIDYILKHLSVNDKPFKWNFYQTMPFLWQVSNRSNRCVQSYWDDIRQSRLSVIPSSIFGSIVWRGRPMSDVLPDYREGFSFHEEWLAMKLERDDSVQSRAAKFLIPTQETIATAKYEYVRYWKAVLKVYLKRRLH